MCGFKQLGQSVHSFNNYLLYTYYVPYMVLGTGNRKVLHRAYFLAVRVLFKYVEP